MLDGGNIVECSADTGCEPVGRAMLKSTRRQHQIDFFRWVAVIGIADIRSEKRRTDHDVPSFLNAAGSKNHAVGMVLRPVIARISATSCPHYPIDLGFNVIESAYKFRENWRGLLCWHFGFS